MSSTDHAPAQASPSATVDLTADTFFPNVRREGIVLVDWWAAWCGPCRAFAPVYASVAARHPDVLFAKVDTEREGALATAFEIRSIPTLMIFRDGVLLFAQGGMMRAEALESLVAQARAVDMEGVRRRVAELEAKEAAHEPNRPGQA